MKEEHIRFLTKTFLFDGIPVDKVRKMLIDLSCEVRQYLKEEIIYSNDEYERKIGFVLSGKCLISRPSHSGHRIPINTVPEGASFGITSVFSKHDSFPTTITASTVCSILFISSQDLSSLMQQDYRISVNVATFLTERIEFLNDRIAAFSGTSVEEKLVNYILGLYRQYGRADFEFNKKRSADAISCGRASLYRAMDTLTSMGYVSFDNKKIYITDLNGLERMLK